MLSFGLLHCRPNTDIVKLIEEPTDGLIKQLLSLSKDIPHNRGFQSSGGRCQPGKEAFEAAYSVPNKRNTMGMR